MTSTARPADGFEESTVPADASGWRELDPSSVRIEDGFWSPRRELVRTQTLPYQYEQLSSTGRLDALDLRWSPGDEPVPHIFWDSDVAKWIEAASYLLASHPDPALDALVDNTIERLVGAQQPDGYLNVYFTVVEPGHRFTDLQDAHELYCAGHLIEAGVAHFRSTGKRRLLDAICRYADLIATTFGTGPGQLRGYDGHEEIELALVRLARATGEERYRDMATYLVDERGRRPFFFDEEAERRRRPGFFAAHFSDRDDNVQMYREYNQAHLPVREQSVAVGHAVRAMYLYCAMADLASEHGDESLADACRRLWESVTARQMYLTGGIGSSAHNEGFTTDFDLPNATAYAETCAAIGLVQWAHRMAILDGDARYVDVLERALYNNVLAGMSADGTRFFYDNPLASPGTAHRQEWFSVACCPPNLARLMASLEKFIYLVDDDAAEVVVNLYISGRLYLTVAGRPVTLHQAGNFPWDGRVRLQLDVDEPTELTLLLRVPGWCETPRLLIDGAAVDAVATGRGYLRVRRQWHGDEVILLDLPMVAHRTWAHPAVDADAGRVALERGPLVYCFEGADNGNHLDALRLPDDSPIEEAGGVVEGMVALRTRARWERSDSDELYRSDPPDTEITTVTAVPYFSWDNRAPGPMQVWMRR